MRHAVNAGPPSENQQNSKKPHLVKKIINPPCTTTNKLQRLNNAIKAWDNNYYFSK